MLKFLYFFISLLTCILFFSQNIIHSFSGTLSDENVCINYENKDNVVVSDGIAEITINDLLVNTTPHDNSISLIFAADKEYFDFAYLSIPKITNSSSALISYKSETGNWISLGELDTNYPQIINNNNIINVDADNIVYIKLDINGANKNTMLDKPLTAGFNTKSIPPSNLNILAISTSLKYNDNTTDQILTAISKFDVIIKDTAINVPNFVSLLIFFTILILMMLYFYFTIKKDVKII